MAMSDAHKKALAEGRRQARAIKAYLEALSNRRPGRPVTVESVQKRIKDLEARIAAEPNRLRKVDLRQARLDAEKTLESVRQAAGIDKLEAGFAQYAGVYSKRKSIGYQAWREAGVPAHALRAAGIKRG